MPSLIKLLMLALPFLELYVLVEVAHQIGTFNAIILLFLTSLIGTAILKHQGLAILRSVDWRMRNGQAPTAELTAGFWVALGGALMILPGFITDIVGLLCFIPLTRRLIAQLFFRHRQFSYYTYTQTTYETHSKNDAHSEKPKKIGEIIEGEIIK